MVNFTNLAQFDLSYPTQSHYVAHQAYEDYNPHLPPNFILQTQPQYGYITATQSYIPHSHHSPPVPHIHNHHNSEAPVNFESMPAVSMGPPNKARKRKAPTLRADAWEPYKARIIELHHTQKLPLRKVKEVIKEEYGFTAE